ncbi:MAG TPA: CAP domain-containing protein, partial [Longimicrobiales bacterium]|nr:CAP domain-containing protein [Longimicrobiales bacterium]
MKKGDAFVAFLLVALTGCKIIIPETTTSTPSSAPPSSSVTAELMSVAKLVNDYRRSVGCPALVWNKDVAKAAQAHSDDMV